MSKQQRAYDRELYKQRNRIERCFNKLKHFRRFATRYCKTIQAFRSFTALACAWLRLKLYLVLSDRLHRSARAPIGEIGPRCRVRWRRTCSGAGRRP